MASAEFGTDNSGNDRIIVKIAYREKLLIKQIPGAKYDAEMKAWKVPASYNACVALTSVFGKSLTVTDEMRQFAGQKYKEAWRLAEIKDCDYDELDVMGGTLLPLQNQGVRFMVASGNTILADDMGSGKTVMISSLLEMRADPAKHHMVVCPKSVRGTWEKHISNWTGLKPHIITGGAGARRKQIAIFKEEGGVAIINWDVLREHSRLKHYGNTRLSEKDRAMKELNDFEFGYLIADEAHRIVSPKSKWTRALWFLGGQAEHRIAMTGTAIANNPGDFWSLLHFVDPDEWPSKGEYVDRFCSTAYSPYGFGNTITGLNPQTRDEFYHLIDRYFMRRRKEDILGRKIEVVSQTRTVTLPPKQRKMYNNMRDEMIAMIENGTITATNPLSQTGRLVQLCGAPMKEGERNKDGKKTFHMVAPSPKVNELMSLIDDLGDEPLIVWSASNQLLHLAKDAVDKHNDGKKPPITYSFVDGGVVDEDRESEIDKFNNGQTRIFFAMTSAISEGVTLNAARYACYLQRPFSMIQNIQSEKRNNRYGQESDTITIIDIVAEDTIDEHVHEVYGEKTVRLEEINRDQLKEML